MAGCTAVEVDRHDADREQRDAERACDPECRRRRNDRALDVGGEHVDAGGTADQARHLVRRHPHHEQKQQRGQDRGSQQRQRDPGEDLGVVAARHQAGLLHADVEHAQRRPERQIGERKIVARQRPGHSRHRVDVDGRLAQPERRHQHRIAPADIGAEDENPRHGHQQSGNGERQQRERVKQGRARSVGALNHPGHQRAHDEGGHSRPEGEHQGIPEQPQDVPARIGLDEIVEGERAGTKSGVLGERVVEQRGEWNEDQPDRDDDAGDEQDVGQGCQTNRAADRGAGGLPRQAIVCDGHAAPLSSRRLREPVTLRCERSEPRRATARMSGPLILRGSPQRASTSG